MPRSTKRYGVAGSVSFPENWHPNSNAEAQAHAHAVQERQMELTAEANANYEARFARQERLSGDEPDQGSAKGGAVMVRLNEICMYYGNLVQVVGTTNVKEDVVVQTIDGRRWQVEERRLTMVTEEDFLARDTYDPTKVEMGATAELPQE